MKLKNINQYILVRRRHQLVLFVIEMNRRSFLLPVYEVDYQTLERHSDDISTVQNIPEKKYKTSGYQDTLNIFHLQEKKKIG
jgi:hypothetical protein